MQSQLESNRQQDTNGWYEIKRNPLSKVGVFEYLGRSIGAPEPDKIYRVLRPESVLSDPATIDSLKLIPWVDDHTMLGNSDEGMMPAERKGIQGVVGEEVFYEDGILYGNIKIFSESMKNLIENNKKELSLGYRCNYDFVGGIFNGEQYDAIQKDIRGNHLALVQEGRMGKDVAVLDHNEFIFTIDAKEIIKMADENKPADGEGEGKSDMTVADLTAAVKQLMPLIEIVKQLQGSGEPEAEAPAEDVGNGIQPEKPTGDEDKEAMGAMDEKLKGLSEKLETFEKGGIKAVMGAIAGRDKLYNKVSSLIGAFDYSLMTEKEIAVKAVKQLELDCEDGAEVSAVNAYLAATKKSQPTFSFTGDSVASNPVAERIANKGAK